MGFGEGGLKGFLSRATTQDSTLKGKGYKQVGFGGSTDSDRWVAPDGATMSGTAARTKSATTPVNIHGTPNDPKKVFPKSGELDAGVNEIKKKKKIYADLKAEE